MKIDPTVTFWISLITTVFQGITSGTVHLTGIVPPDWLPVVTGWMGLIVFVNMSFLTAMSGFSSSARGPLAPPPTVTEAKALMSAAVDASK